MNRRQRLSKVGNDRVKSGMKDVYVVCEDLRSAVREIKIEYDMDGGVNACMDASDITRGEIDEALGVGSRLRKFVCNSSNKVTKFVASRLLEESECYMEIIQRLLCDNER